MNPVIYQDVRNSKLKLWAKSKDNNFLLGCPIVSRSVLRRWNSEQKLWAKSNDNNFLLGYPNESRNISRRSKFRIDALSKI